jgi:hypothetical protein
MCHDNASGPHVAAEGPECARPESTLAEVVDVNTSHPSRCQRYRSHTPSDPLKCFMEIDSEDLRSATVAVRYHLENVLFHCVAAIPAPNWRPGI